MADSPFASDLPVDQPAPELEARPRAEPKSLGKLRLDSTLAALGTLAAFTPLGRFGRLTATPTRRAILGASVGTGIGAAAEVAGAEQGKPPEKPHDPGAGFASPMHEIQARLTKSGLYRGPIDGISLPGQATEKALDRLHQLYGPGDPLHILRMNTDPTYRASEEAKGEEKLKLENQKAQADKATAETKRRGQLDEDIKKAVAETKTWQSQLLQLVPYTVGGAAGAFFGGLPGAQARSASAKAAKEAEAFAAQKFGAQLPDIPAKPGWLGSNFRSKPAQKAPPAGPVPGPVTPDDLADRAASVNVYWGRGRGREPFTQLATAGEISPNSMSWQVQNHTPVEDLYKFTPGDRAKRLGYDALAASLAAGDYAGGQWMSGKNERYADEARERFAQSKSSADATQEVKARNAAYVYNAASQGAFPFLAMYGATRSKILPAKYTQPRMEAQQAAERNRLAVQDYLNRQPLGGPGPRNPVRGGGPVAPGGGGQQVPINGGPLNPVGPQPIGGGGGPQPVGGPGQQVTPPNRQIAGPGAGPGGGPGGGPAGPAGGGGIGGHTSGLAGDAKNIRKANFDKIVVGTGAKQSEQAMEDAIRASGVQPTADGRYMMTLKWVRELARQLEALHATNGVNLPISHERLKSYLLNRYRVHVIR